MPRPGDRCSFLDFLQAGQTSRSDSLPSRASQFLEEGAVVGEQHPLFGGNEGRKPGWTASASFSRQFFFKLISGAFHNFWNTPTKRRKGNQEVEKLNPDGDTSFTAISSPAAIE